MSFEVQIVTINGLTPRGFYLWTDKHHMVVKPLADQNFEDQNIEKLTLATPFWVIRGTQNGVANTTLMCFLHVVNQDLSQLMA